MVAHVATLQSLDHRVTGNAHWLQDRWAQCCSTALVAQLHPGRDAIQGYITSMIRTAKCRFTPSSDSHTRWHSDLLSHGSLRCDQCASRNSHSMLRIAHARLHPQHHLVRVHSNPPAQAVTNRQFQGLEPSSVLPRLLYTLLRAAIRTLGRKSANCCSRAQRANSEGSTNCMPTPSL